MPVTWNFTNPLLNNNTNLTQNQSVMVIIETNYTTDGKKEPELKAYSGNFLSTLKDKFTIYLLELLDFQILDEDIDSSISEIVARSNDENKTISWQTISWQSGIVDETISSSIPINLSASEQVFIIIEDGYTPTYVYYTNASVSSSDYEDQEQGFAVIS